MDRRTFVASSVAAAAGGAIGGGSALAQTTSASPEYYELRRYELRVGPMVQRMNDYLKDVALPAYTRAGVSPVGVFNVQFGIESPTLFLLLTYKSLSDFGGLAKKLADDAAYQKAAAEHASVPATDPSYVRIDSQLMVAFEGMPRIEVPAGAAGNKPRIFELRTYESHSKKASRKKLEMFGKGGELAIFRRTGLTPVFFGENVIGQRLPSFTYMLVYDDMAAREKGWATFLEDPEWKKLRATPGYTDPEIVSNTQAMILRATGYSQI